MRTLTSSLDRESLETLEGRLRRTPGELPEGRFRCAPREAELCEIVRAPAPAAAPEVVEAIASACRLAGDTAGAALSDRLRLPGARVVVAGQQPALFGGPLLVQAKAASAVLLARRLELATGIPVVPVFWNHSEDHDLAEANRFSVFRDGSPMRLRANLEDRGRVLESLTIDAPAAAFTRRVLTDLGFEEQEYAAREGERFAAWSGRLVRAALGSLPILEVEPRTLRPFGGNLIGQVVEDIKGFGAAARRGQDAVRDAGFPVQVQVNDSSPLFLIGPDGSRVRVLADGGWRVPRAERLPGALAERVRPEGFARWAAEHPGAFSANVTLRPLLLQRILPVAAHIVGPAEAAYFAGLPELFAWAGASLPAVVPRLSGVVLDRAARDALGTVGLPEGDVLEDPQTWPETARLGAAAHQLAQWTHPRGRPQERVFGPLALRPGVAVSWTGEAFGGCDVLDFRRRVIIVGDEETGHERES